MVLDRLGGEEVGELVAARVLVGPLLDSGKHVTLDLNIVASSSRVVKCADHIVDDFVNGDRRVLPSIENSRDNVLKNRGGNATSTRVQDICEVVLGQHGVSWIRASRVFPGLQLRLGAGRDHAGRAILQHLGHLRNDGPDERGEEAEDKGRQSLTDFFQKAL